MSVLGKLESFDGYKITKDELLNEITNGAKPLFYDAKKVALSVDLANKEASPKVLIKNFGVHFAQTCDGVPTTEIDGTTLIIPSKSLVSHLTDCDKIWLVCATLGHAADREIEKTKAEDMEVAVLLDAAFLLIIEKYLDAVQQEISADAQARGKQITPRFSLGYNDSPLEKQGEFLNVLNAEKRLGVCVTEGGMMLPSKTVTAMIGEKPVF